MQNDQQATREHSRERCGPSPKSTQDRATQHTERWPDAQIIAMRDTCAAILTKLGYGAERVITHKEYAGAAQGKWDPGNLDPGWMRGEITKAMRGDFKPKPKPPVDPTPPTMTDRQLLEAIWAKVSAL